MKKLLLLILIIVIFGSCAKSKFCASCTLYGVKHTEDYCGTSSEVDDYINSVSKLGYVCTKSPQ